MELGSGAGGPEAAGPAVPGETQVATGDTRVDEAVGRLTDLSDMPISEHPAVFEYVHQQLSDALGDLEAHDQAVAREHPGRPGH